eukprot:4313325-Amphidinium_carterae.1
MQTDAQNRQYAELPNGLILCSGDIEAAHTHRHMGSSLRTSPRDCSTQASCSRSDRPWPTAQTGQSSSLHA